MKEQQIAQMNKKIMIFANIFEGQNNRINFNTSQNKIDYF